MMTDKPFIKVPTWKDGQWVERTHFQTRDEFIAFIEPLFKTPGEYELDETSKLFNEQARLFTENKVYCSAATGSRAFTAYWDAERRKCRRGVLFIKGHKTWYLPGFYYMFLNFLQIYNKEKKTFSFADVRDAQLYVSLYIFLAELNYEHAAILKKRQIAFSYLMMALLIRDIWFEDGPVLKLGASQAKYINLRGDWKFLNEYKSFLNKHTAWKRDMNPGGEGHWEQKVDLKDSSTGMVTTEGLKGSLSAISFDRSSTEGVGGPCSRMIYEEGGIAPTADITFEFMESAFKSGEIKTGQFIIGGSVGELEHCEPLKDFLLNPDDNDMRAVEHNLMDENNVSGRTALFVGEQYSMPPYIDDYGNSLVDEALNAIKNVIRPEWKRKLSAERYRYRVSQHPINITEAFGARKESKFPLNLVNAQKLRIKNNQYALEYVDLERDDKGEIVIKKSKKLPLSDFPIKKNTVNKESVVVIHERPNPNAAWGTYIGSIDPVSEGKSITSESLCSIYIYKMPVQVTQHKSGETDSFIEEGKLVAWWCGRYDNLNKTHELLEMLIELYNAWSLVENNISLFIQHMIAKRKQKFLIPKKMVSYVKELESKSGFQEYGWRNTGNTFRHLLLNYLIEFLKEETDEITKEDGEIIKKIYGIERIPDIMALEEMLAYHDKLNVDRLVALAALVAFLVMFQSNTGYARRIDTDEDNQLDKSEKMTNLNKTPFRNIGKSGGGLNKPRRSPFKNVR